MRRHSRLACIALLATCAIPAFAQDPANMDAVKTADPAAVFGSGRAAPPARAILREPSLQSLYAQDKTPPAQANQGLPPELLAAMAAGQGQQQQAGQETNPSAQVGMGMAQDAMQAMEQTLMPIIRDGRDQVQQGLNQAGR